MKKSIVALSLTVGLLLPVSSFAQNGNGNGGGGQEQYGGGGHDTTATADAVAVGTATNINAPTTTMTTTIDPTIQVGAGVEIVDNGVNNSRTTVVNRQIPMVGIPGGPEAMQYFGAWKDVPAWNVFPPSIGMKWVKSGEKVTDTPYREIFKRIYTTYPKTEAVSMVGFGAGKGELTGQMSVILNPEQGTPDAEAIVVTEAMRIGATTVEVLSSSSNQLPTSSGWHIGTGVGAGGVVGDGEKATVSGAGGTGFGKSDLDVKSLPFMQVRFWHNGDGTSSVTKTETPATSSSSVVPVSQKWEAGK